MTDFPTSQPVPQQPDNGEENILNQVLKYYDQYVRPYFWLYPAGLALALLAGLIYSWTVTPLFRASCRMQITSQEMRPLDVRNVMDTGGGNSFLQTQITILKESFILRDAMNRLGTAGENSAGFSGPAISTIPGTNLVDISFSSPDPNLAASISNALADAYISFYKERRGDISSSGEGLLRDQLKDAERNRDHAMTDLLLFKEKHGIYDFQQCRTALTTRLDTLQTKISEAEMDIVEITRTLEDIDKHRSEAALLLPFLIPQEQAQSNGGTASPTTFQMMIINHDMALPKLLADYGEMHTAVRSHREVRKMLLKAQDDAVNTAIRGLKMKRERLQLNKQQNQALMREIEKKLSDLDHLGGAYTQKEDAYKAFTATCTTLINRINEIKIAAASTKVDNFSVAVIDRARTPGSPYYPVTKQILLRSALIGLGLAFAISFVLITLDVNVTDLDAVRQAIRLQLPCYGIVPRFHKDESELMEDKSDSEVDLVFQNIRTSLNLSMQTRGTKLLAVSSSIQGEGKTFISYHLARSFAKDGRRTLLLELDLRLPRVKKLLKAYLPEGSDKKGISNVLINDCKLEDVVIPLPKLGIDVALTGPVPPNPNELIGSQSLKNLLEEASRLYDLTVIDTPPIVPITDTMLLAAMNLPLLLVVRYNHVTRTDLHQLSDKLTQVNLKPVGIIVNDEEDSPKGYKKGKYGYSKYSYRSYSRGYGYGYGYGYGEKHHDKEDTPEKDDNASTPVDDKTKQDKKN